MRERTKQEIFNLAFEGLRAQGFAQSLDHDGYAKSCAYRDRDGLKCALGHCIDDANYDQALEGMGADEPPVLFAARISERDLEFADQLQDCHDKAAGPVDMERRLRDFAADHNLTVPEAQS